MPQDHQRAPTRVIKTLQPEDAGARRWAAEYGDRLVCVRYRMDLKRQRRKTTVELVVEDVPRLGALPVAVQVAFEETALRQQVRAAGGTWDARAKLWRLPLDTARRLGLTERIVEFQEPKP